MAQTLTALDALNISLKKARLIQGEENDLTSFTFASFQPDVDIMLDAWREVVYFLADLPGVLQNFEKQGSITLAAETNKYALPSDFEGFVDGMEYMVDETNNYILRPFPGGYAAWRQLYQPQLEPGYLDGQPHYYFIYPHSTGSGQLGIDKRPPTGDELVGNVYSYTYRASCPDFANPTDTFPFSDEVVRELVIPAVEVWKRETNREFDDARFQISMGRAVTKVNHIVPATSYA